MILVYQIMATKVNSTINYKIMQPFIWKIKIPAPIIPSLTIEVTKESTRPSYICNNCKLDFTDLKDYSHHVENTDSIIVHEEVSTLSQTPESEPKSSILHTGFCYYCPFCKRRFQSFQGYKRHMGKLHQTKSKNFICLKCDRKFISKYALKIHGRRLHDNMAQVNCEKCQRIFFNKYQYNRHLKSHA